MLKFEYIRFKNILSYGNEFSELSLNESKKTLISGSNGAGKSTIFKALKYGLYGTSKSKLELLINNVNKKKLEVHVGFYNYNNDFIEIIRGMKPKKFQVFKNEIEIDEIDQKTFENDYLKLPETIFEQIVSLNLKKFRSFIELKPKEKRDFINKIFGIDFSNEINKIKDLRSSIQEKIIVLENSISIYDKELKKKEKELEKINEKPLDISEQKKKKENLIEVFKLNIENFKKESEKLQIKIDKYKPNQKRIFSFFFKRRFFSSRMLRIDENYLFSLFSDFIFEIKKVKDKQSSFKKNKDITEKEINYYNQQIELCKKDIEHFSELEQVHQDNIYKIQSEIDNLNKKLSGFKSKLKSSQKYLENIKFILEVLQGEVEKHYLKKILPYLNSIVNTILQEVGGEFFIELHEDFTISVEKNDEIVDLENLSDGQLTRLKITLIFVFIEILQMKHSYFATNLLSLDEIFDASLDIEGMEKFFVLLDEKFKDKNVFIISHRLDDNYKEDWFEQCFLVNFENFSKIIEDN